MQSDTEDRYVQTILKGVMFLEGSAPKQRVSVLRIESLCAQVIDYSGGRTLDDMIEYVERRVAGIIDEEDDDDADDDDNDDDDEGDDDEGGASDYEDDGEEPEIPKDEL